MKTLDEAWRWYTDTRKLLRLIRRLAAGYWDLLPWEGTLGKDNMLKHEAGPPLVRAADYSIEQFDDLAIVVLFSVFESAVRERVRSEVAAEGRTIRHPVLRFAAEEALKGIDRGSFFRVLLALKRIDYNLAEQVRQIRRYRNWVSLGKRGPAPFELNPRDAYERLTTFLGVLGQVAP